VLEFDENDWFLWKLMKMILFLKIDENDNFLKIDEIDNFLKIDENDNFLIDENLFDTMLAIVKNVEKFWELMKMIKLWWKNGENYQIFAVENDIIWLTNIDEIW